MRIRGSSARRATWALALFLVAFACTGPPQEGSSEPTDEAPSPAAGGTPQVQEPVTHDAVIAFQVSHQDDTGFDNWHEWAISGDIAIRAARMMDYASLAFAWDLTGPLSGTNRYVPEPTNAEDFDSEVAFANEHGADIFISFHNDGGAPSGVLALVHPDDGDSRQLSESMLEALSERAGLPNRGILEGRLYSIEPERNTSRYRLILELGDNVSDREFLESAKSRQMLAETVADELERFVRERFPRADRPPFRVLQPEALAGRDPRAVLAEEGLGPEPTGSLREALMVSSGEGPTDAP